MLVSISHMRKNTFSGGHAKLNSLLEKFIKRATLLSLFLFYVSGVLAKQNEEFRGLPEIINYSPELYRAGIQNWDIIQTQSGLIYVANNQGLLEFDGQTWKRYGINDTKVRSAIQASDGRIYVGSQADFGLLEPNGSGALEYRSLKSFLPEEHQDFDETWKIFEINEEIYFCTFQGVFIYDGEGIRVVRNENRLDISFAVNNELYAFEYQKGLVRKEGDEFVEVRNGDFFEDKRISNILPFDRDRLLISTFEKGAFLYNGEVEPFDFKGDFWRDNYYINYSARLRDGTIALASQNAGLFFGEFQR